ncbi:MAG TPA: CpsB/CapC family capsule biosynthesis tyrosine phosphatase [Myxococcota bacterium]|jgi:protein-tyrosine phosphatase
MIDLHCHIHPGVDDGCQTVDESRALARALVNAGVTTAAATSHVRPDKGWMNTRVDDAARRARLASILDGIPLQIVGGAEHYMHEVVIGDALVDIALPYGSSRWLLVETPYLGEPPNLLELLHGIRKRGFKILLAHVERFPYLEKHWQTIVDAGMIVQVNLGSLAGAYNRQQQKAAERLLKEGFAGVLAGDCHREQDVADNIVAGRKAAKKIISDDVLERLTTTNPQRILDDASPAQVWP